MERVVPGGGGVDWKSLGGISPVGVARGGEVKGTGEFRAGGERGWAGRLEIDTGEGGMLR